MSTAGIIGQPPEVAGHTRLYLSGPRADEVRVLFSRSRLDARIAEGPLYAASTVKMAYAAWTKGSSALLLAARALARAGGVERTLLAEWQLSQPSLTAQSERSAAAAAAKGWRWIGEMEEIAASMSAAGLPDGLPRGRRRALRPRLPRRRPHRPQDGDHGQGDPRQHHVRPDVTAAGPGVRALTATWQLGLVAGRVRAGDPLAPAASVSQGAIQV